VTEANKLRMGDPLGALTTIGPLAQPHHGAFVEAQVRACACWRSGLGAYLSGFSSQRVRRGPHICSFARILLVPPVPGPSLALFPYRSSRRARSARAC
jgi:hypothetical protein